MRPRLLDLFCGAGGAAVGYHRAGFDVVGVDIVPQPNYPFKFIQADALEFLDRWLVLRSEHDWPASWFDAVHASPPCQAYTTMNNRHGSSSPPLIDETRELLEATGLPWVIENVAGAKRVMRNPIRLTGEQFGLRVHRPRLFETNWPLTGLPSAGRQPRPTAVYGKNDGRRLWTRKDGSELRVASLEEARAGLGIDWMDWRELCESIPPAYTQFVGEQLLAWVEAADPAPTANGLPLEVGLHD